MNAAGNFVITWDYYEQDGPFRDIFARRYATDGTPLGGIFRVNTFNSTYQREPTVSMDASGNFVIVWGSSGQDGSGWGIYAQRYAADGTPLGGEFQVNTYTINDQSLPSIGMNASGNFVIVWESSGQDGSEWGIYARRYAADGTPLGSEFRVNSYTSSTQYYPSVGMDAAGNFVIAWDSYMQDGSEHGIYAQRYAADGKRLGEEFRVNTSTDSSQTNPSVGMDAIGNFVIAWTTHVDFMVEKHEIYAQRYAADGTPLGEEFQVNTYIQDSQANPSVKMDAMGNFVIAWTSNWQDGSDVGIYAQRYTADGMPLDEEFQVNTMTQGKQFEPSVGINSVGSFIISWASEEQGGNNWNLYAQRFAGGFTPAFSLTSITPNLDSTSGGTPITLTGTYFQPDATVTIGGVPATDVTVVSETEITATTPAVGVAGVYDVVVTNPDGHSSTLPYGFTYTFLYTERFLQTGLRPDVEGNVTVRLPDKMPIGSSMVLVAQNLTLDELPTTADAFLGAVAGAYVGNPDLGGALIGTDAINVPAGGTATAEITWMPETAGAFEFFVSVNRDGAIGESDYSDNTASKMISASSEAIYIDCGDDESDIKYDAIIGYGYLDGFPLTDWGDEPYQTVRIDFDGEVRYRFDNLNSGKYYHLDFSFYEGDGMGRIAEVWVDGVKIGEQIALSATPNYPSFGVPTETYTDGTITVSIKRSGKGDIVVSELRLIRIDKIPIDCGSPSDLAYSAERGYGYLDGQPFTDWGDLPYQTVRLDMDGEVRYRFDNLRPDKRYQVNFTFYEGDGGKRNEEVWVDGIFTGVSVFLGDGQIHYEHVDVLKNLYESDGSIVVSIKKTKGIGAVVSEIALEEQTSLSPSCPIKGDVSGNGEITAYDASLILQAVVGLIPFPDNPDYPCFTLENADVSGSGSLSALDAAMILQYTVGLIDGFPVQQPTSERLAYRQFTRQMFVTQISDDASVAQISNLAMKSQEPAKIESWATRQFVMSISLDEASGVLAGELCIQKPAAMRVEGITAHPNFMVEWLEGENTTQAKQLALQENEIKLVFATAEPVSGRTTLAYITLDVPINEQDSIDSPSQTFSLVGAELNEGTIPVYWRETIWDDLQAGQDRKRPIQVGLDGGGDEDAPIAQTEQFVLQVPQVTRTRWAVWFYSLNSTFEGRPLQVGDVVIVKDADGVICGVYVVDREGGYGYMPVYGDDPRTEADEGATDGDELTFYINGQCAHTLGFDEPLWTLDVMRREVDLTTGACLHLSGEVFINSQSAPAGTVITAHSEDGCEIARYIVRKAGQYGVMHIRENCGLQSGDVIKLSVDGQGVELTGEDIVWDGESRSVDLAVHVE